MTAVTIPLTGEVGTMSVPDKPPMTLCKHPQVSMKNARWNSTDPISTFWVRYYSLEYITSNGLAIYVEDER